MRSKTRRPADARFCAEPLTLLEAFDVAAEVEDAADTDRGVDGRAPVVDPILMLEGTSEEAAAWQQAGELELELAVTHVRRAQAIARGYVLARRAGRGREDAVAELMGTFAVSRVAAENDLDEALHLVCHPRSVQAVHDRRFGLRQLRALLDVLAGLEQPLADQVETAMLSRMAGRSPARIREAARRVALRLDPQAAADRRTRATRKRAVRLHDAGDGMVELTLLVRAEHGLAVLHRAERETAHDDGSGRTRDQRRADWCIETLLAEPARPGTAGVGPATDLVLDGRRRRPTQVLVHVPVTTALGLDDEPCELAEIGPVDAEHGRLLLTTAELRKVCVDERTGEVLHVEATVHRPVPDVDRIRGLVEQGHSAGVARAQAQAEAVRAAVLGMVHTPSVMPTLEEPQYRPSAALSRTVRTRHPRCDFLTCRQPSRHCDDEHTLAWPRGGTQRENLAPRSRWCHRRKQDGWTPTPLPDGSTQWVSPSGRTYLAPAQHEPPPSLEAGARLLPGTAPPSLDDHGPPDDEPEPRPRAADDRDIGGSEAGPPASPPGFRHGWPDVAEF